MGRDRSALANGAIADLIDRLAGLERLGLFVGAGVSVEAGLPSWNTLLHRLLHRIAGTTESFRRARADGSVETGEGLDPSIDDFASITLRTLGPLGAAAVVKQHLAGNYLAEVRAALYREAKALGPGPTAIACARLILDTDPTERVPVLTTNFDLLLELALIAELERRGEDPTTIMTLLPGQDLPAGRIGVVHLHGVVPHPGHSQTSSPEIVFAEDEFLGESATTREARRQGEELLAGTPYLFLGTSLTDPNILSYLYRCARGNVRHTAIAVSQQAANELDPDARRVVIDSLQETGAARLRKARMDLGFVDTYAEASQVMLELNLQRAALGEDMGCYRSSTRCWERRAHRFEQRALRAGLLPSDRGPEAFISLQPRLRPALEEIRRRLQDLFGEIPALEDRDEHLGLHLWVHAPETGLLAMVAKSDQEIFSPATLQVARSSLPSRYLVVEALCNGTVVEAASPGLASSRWGSMLAVPFAIAEEREQIGGAIASINAGVIVLASTNSGDAGLSRLRALPEERSPLIAALSEAGAQLTRHPVEAVEELDEQAVPLAYIDIPTRIAEAAESDYGRRLGSESRAGSAPSATAALGRWAGLVPQDLRERVLGGA